MMRVLYVRPICDMSNTITANDLEWNLNRRTLTRWNISRVGLRCLRIRIIPRIVYEVLVALCVKVFDYCNSLLIATSFQVYSVVTLGHYGSKEISALEQLRQRRLYICRPLLQALGPACEACGRLLWEGQAGKMITSSQDKGLHHVR